MNLAFAALLYLNLIQIQKWNFTLEKTPDLELGLVHTLDNRLKPRTVARETSL